MGLVVAAGSAFFDALSLTEEAARETHTRDPKP